MKTLFLISAIITSIGFCNVVKADEKNGAADNPAQASIAFVVGLSSKQEVVIVEKLRSSKNISWKDIEKKVKETSATYREALVELGHERRLLVCVFEHKDMGINMYIYKHYAIYQNKITISRGKRLSISELFQSRK